MQRTKNSASLLLKLLETDTVRLEAAEKKIRKNYIDFLQGLWKDFLQELSEIFAEALEVPFEKRPLSETFALIGKIVEMHRDRLKELKKAFEEKMKRELVEDFGEIAKVSMKAFDEMFEMLRILHLFYLHSGDEWFLDLSIMLYALLKSSVAGAAYVVAGLGYFLQGKTLEAFALAAYGARENLPKRAPVTKPWENPSQWARALKVSYHYDVGMRVVSELLNSWGFQDVVFNLE
ncbi:MAG: hypothetical protein GU357_00040 [Thermofilum sp.]|jgi:hypothetical protein|nr:hypothetical protein [Thermofilum sp.]